MRGGGGGSGGVEGGLKKKKEKGRAQQKKSDKPRELYRDEQADGGGLGTWRKSALQVKRGQTWFHIPESRRSMLGETKRRHGGRKKERLGLLETNWVI